MIAKALLEAGLLQFGLFVEAEKEKPYRLKLEMLAAYPQLTQQLVYYGSQIIAQKPYERIVAHSDCIPFAAALSLQTGIPLVYSRGKAESPVFDLIGAYDVGHPAILIVNSIEEDTKSLIKNCQTVGLEVKTILEIVSQGELIPEIEQVTIVSMETLIHEMQQEQLIPDELITTLLASI